MNLKLLKLYLRRDLFSHWQFSLLTVASIALGVGAVIGIHSYKENLSNAIRSEAKVLMGADVALQSPHPMDQSLIEKIQKTLPPGSEISKNMQFLSMVQSKSEESSLTFVKGFEKSYPFYGTFVTEPPNALDRISKGKILLDRNLGKNLKVSLGESISLGDTTFEILGWIEKEPGSIGSFMGTAPSSIVMLSDLDSTGLVQRGSRVRYNLFVKFPSDVDSLQWKRNQFKTLIEEDVTIYHNTEVNSGSQQFLTNTFDFMILLGLFGFFLGAVSIFTAIRARLADKKNEIAILKCIGIEPGTTSFLVVSEIIVMSLLGTVLGMILAIQIQRLVPDIAGSDFLKKIPIGISPGALFWGCLLGIFIPLAVSIFPVLQTSYVKPIHALKEIEDRELQKNEKGLFLLSFFFIYLLFFGLAYWETNSLLKGFLFSIVIVSLPTLVFVLYSFLGLGLKVLLSRNLFPKEWSLTLKKFTRKASQLRLSILGLGSALFILCLTFVMQESLLELSGAREKVRRPNLFVLDIKKDQIEGVEENFGLYKAQNVIFAPMIGARLSKINGERVKKEDTIQEAGERTWRSTARTREYFLSYRDSLYDTEKVTDGQWWNPSSLDEISVERDFSKYLGASIGDTLSFNVQGREIEGKITNLRSVNWSDMKPNFVVLFSRGQLEKAPSFYISTLLIEEGESRYQLQKSLVKQFPNLTIIDTEKAVQSFMGILEKVSEMVRLMTGFIFATAFVLVFTTLYSSEKERRKEIALLRVIGAEGHFLYKYFSKEALVLGMLAFGIGALYSLLANYFLNEYVLEWKPVYPWLDFAKLLGITVVTCISVYSLGLVSLIRQPVKTILK